MNESGRKKLRVGLLCVGWPGRPEVGGAARYAFRYAELIRDAVDLHIITSEGGYALGGVTMHTLANRGGRFDHYYRFPLRVSRLLHDLDLDILHAFGDDWAIAGHRFGWVRTFHGSSFSEAKASKGLRKWNHLVLGLLEHSVRRRCDLAVSVGPEGESEFRTDLLIPPITPRRDLFSPSTPTAEPSAVFVGTWSGRKRGAMAADAVQEASNRLHRAIQLRVIGPAEDAANWPSNVEHLSGLDDLEVAHAIRESWVLLAPSSYEGFGIPAFEAASMGVASISTPNPGSTFLAAHVKSELFEVVDEDCFVEALVRRIERGPIVDSEGLRDAVAVTDDLASRASADSFIRLYESVLKERRRHGG